MNSVEPSTVFLQPKSKRLDVFSYTEDAERLRQGQGPPGESPPPRRRFCFSKNCRERDKQPRTQSVRGKADGRRAKARTRGGVFALAKTAVSAINTYDIGICFAKITSEHLFLKVNANLCGILRGVKIL